MNLIQLVLQRYFKMPMFIFIWKKKRIKKLIEIFFTRHSKNFTNTMDIDTDLSLWRCDTDLFAAHWPISSIYMWIVIQL